MVRGGTLKRVDQRTVEKAQFKTETEEICYKIGEQIKDMILDSTESDKGDCNNNFGEE